MPVSSPENKEWIKARVLELKPSSVIDVGPGVGTYSDLLREHTPGCYWVGVEVFDPYVWEYDLCSKYDLIANRDVRQVPTLNADLVIFGDVLEHMTRPDALAVLANAKKWARAIVVSVPIIHSPQGSCFGNDAETHLDQWWPGQFQEHLPGCEWIEGDIIGTYWWTS